MIGCMSRRHFTAAAAGALVSSGAARAARPIRIAVLTELSGPNTSGIGPGSVIAAQMAVADAASGDPALPVELLSADHQASADTALQISRDWLDTRDVDAIVNVNNSAAALAVADLVRQRDKVAR